MRQWRQDFLVTYLVYMDYEGSTRAAASGLWLLRRRCDSCSSQLSGESLFPSPGLAAEVSDAAAFLQRGALRTRSASRSSSSCLCSCPTLSESGLHSVWNLYLLIVHLEGLFALVATLASMLATVFCSSARLFTPRLALSLFSGSASNALAATCLFLRWSPTGRPTCFAVRVWSALAAQS